MGSVITDCIYFLRRAKVALNQITVPNSYINLVNGTGHFRLLLLLLGTIVTLTRFFL
jgi:hypothetical protein